MSNVLSKEERNNKSSHWGGSDGRSGAIQQATGVHKETASAYLKSAGVVVCLPGWGRRAPSKPAIGVTADPLASQLTSD